MEEKNCFPIFEPGGFPMMEISYGLYLENLVLRCVGNLILLSAALIQGGKKKWSTIKKRSCH